MTGNIFDNIGADGAVGGASRTGQGGGAPMDLVERSRQREAKGRDPVQTPGQKAWDEVGRKSDIAVGGNRQEIGMTGLPGGNLNSDF